LSLEDGAHNISLNDAHGLTGAERLARLENGEDQPTRALLTRMAKAYRRSLLVFYLSTPPKTGDRGQDFRTVPGAAPPQFDPDLDALLRDIRARQSLVKSLQEDLEAEPVAFIGSATMDIPVERLAQHIAESIRFDRREFRARKTVDLAFSYLRTKIEDAGVFVLLLGNLGSHHTSIPADRFRGFAIADPLAPFVVVNDQDSKPAWCFTALHELVHLWLGTTGISGASAAAKIERYCNDVAGEILLPAAELDELRELSGAPLDSAIETISQFARARHVSRSMVAYRAFRAGVISERTWSSLDHRFRQAWLEGQEVPRKSAEGGPSYYVVRRHKLGNALLDLVSNSLKDGSLTYTKAGQILGVKPRNVDPLVRSSVKAH
jgi:Zn-dependent peptidase ImmA (M78 family)